MQQILILRYAALKDYSQKVAVAEIIVFEYPFQERVKIGIFQNKRIRIKADRIH